MTMESFKGGQCTYGRPRSVYRFLEAVREKKIISLVIDYKRRTCPAQLIKDGC